MWTGNTSLTPLYLPLRRSFVVVFRQRKVRSVVVRTVVDSPLRTVRRESIVYGPLCSVRWVQSVVIGPFCGRSVVVRFLVVYTHTYTRVKEVDSSL